MSSNMTLEDIASSLEKVCRWGGHCLQFYSVAQHAVSVADMIELETGNTLAALYGLHHDDHESVRGDIPSPRKRFLKKHGQLYKGEEIAEDEYIYGKLLGLEYPFPKEIKEIVELYDKKALFTERRYLKQHMKWHQDDYKEVEPLSKDEFAVYLDYQPGDFLLYHNNLKEQLNA